MHSRSTRWQKWLLISVCTLSGVVFLWTLAEDLSPREFPAELSRSAAAVYGTVRESAGHREIVIEEVWKAPSDAHRLTVGGTLSAGPLPRDARPDAVLVLFERPWSLGRRSLRFQALYAVYDGRIGRDGMSIAEAKASCAGTPGI